MELVLEQQGSCGAEVGRLEWLCSRGYGYACCDVAGWSGRAGAAGKLQGRGRRQVLQRCCRCEGGRVNCDTFGNCLRKCES